MRQFRPCFLCVAAWLLLPPAVTAAHVRSIESFDANGIFLKSRDGRGGYIENVTGENLTIRNSPTFLGIDLLDKGIPASDPVTGDPQKWTQLSHIRFDHIRVDNVARLVLANDIPSQRPVTDFSLTEVQGTCGRALSLANMTNVVLAGIRVTDYHGPFLTKVNV